MNSNYHLCEVVFLFLDLFTSQFQLLNLRLKWLFFSLQFFNFATPCIRFLYKQVPIKFYTQFCVGQDTGSTQTDQANRAVGSPWMFATSKPSMEPAVEHAINFQFHIPPLSCFIYLPVSSILTSRRWLFFQQAAFHCQSFLYPQSHVVEVGLSAPRILRSGESPADHKGLQNKLWN